MCGGRDRARIRTVPVQRIKPQIVEHMVDFLARRTRQAIVEQERQILEQMVEGAKVIPQERTSDVLVEQCDEQFVSRFEEEIVEVVQITPLEQVQQVQGLIGEQEFERDRCSGDVFPHE